MRVHYLQHEPFEGLGSMEPWFHAHGDLLASTHLYADPRLPGVADFDWLVIMGGGMSVNDEARLPWLRPEKQLVRTAIDAGRTVLGVCLGAQMIANVLGARVYRNKVKEVGWWPVEREPGTGAGPLSAVFPPRSDAFHWHGETFDLPVGAVRLARSEACLNQAFALGERVVGLQFHLETTVESARGLIEGSAADLAPGPFIQPAADILARPERFMELNRLMARLLETLAARRP